MARTQDDTPAELVSIREYARRRGIAHVTVIRAIQSGRISTVGGKINPMVADREWEENTDLSTPRNRITGRPRMQKGLDEPAVLESTPEAHGGNGSNVTGYQKARAAREVYQAQLAKLNVDRQRGVLIRSDDVKLAAFNSARRARDQLIVLPERMATLLAAITDPLKIQSLLEEEIERICAELSDGNG